MRKFQIVRDYHEEDVFLYDKEEIEIKESSENFSEAENLMEMEEVVGQEDIITYVDAEGIDE